MQLLRIFKRVLDRLLFQALHSITGKRKVEASPTVMIVRTDGMGDFVFFTRYLPCLRTFYKGHRFVLVCRSETSPLASGLSFVDKVIDFKYLRYRWNYLYRLLVLRRIRGERPTIAVYASFHRQHIGDEMTLLSGAAKTIAFNGNDEIIHPAMRMKNDRYYMNLVRTQDHIPEKAKYQVLLKVLGISEGNVEEELTMKDHARIVIENPQSSPGKPYVVIGPGGSAEIRRWPAARFASVANALESPFFVLCGSSQERALLEEIAGQMKQKPMVMAGYPIQTIAQVIKSAQLFLGNESGLLHLAASFGTPAIGILGGGHFTRYFPYGSVRIVSHKLPCYECNWKCPYPEPYCITNITLGDVLKEIESLDLLKSPVIK